MVPGLTVAASLDPPGSVEAVVTAHECDADSVEMGEVTEGRKAEEGWAEQHLIQDSVPVPLRLIIAQNCSRRRRAFRHHGPHPPLPPPPTDRSSSVRPSLMVCLITSSFRDNILTPWRQQAF